MTWLWIALVCWSVVALAMAWASIREWEAGRRVSGLVVAAFSGGCVGLVVVIVHGMWSRS
jgi:hypothetical protein